MSGKYFSANYEQARERFTEAAGRVGAEMLSYPVSAKNESGLFIDVALQGPVNATKALVVTSGIHGVEGFFGSAVQLALLESLAQRPFDKDMKVIVVHALNPYGFRHLRRFNEDNVDLNRNFPEAENNYAGAPAGYALHNRFLNPDSVPSRLELFKVKAAWKIWRYGMASLKESIASGQYQYPHGLFFGGNGPSESTRILADHLESWLGEATRIMHVDLHTGLGEYGQYKLLLNESVGSKIYQWFELLYGRELIEALGNEDGTAYPVNGIFGAWCQQQNRSIDYRFVGAEFGTYDVVRVLKALREENCIHRFEPHGSARFNAAKQELLECFCPVDERWRSRVVDAGLGILKTAARSF